jgi:sirohydrochlorin cobaltochelatase
MVSAKILGEGQMTAGSEGRVEFAELEARLRTILPEEYQDGYEDIQPVSMGSAGLQYGRDGKVAWDEIWGSFCDLAMAGGPPHKGTLLEPGGKEEIATQADRYGEVVEEICRGITMVTGLCAERSPVSGWVRMYCTSAAMAGWLARAIVMENVSASFKGLALDLPAGPAYRIEKEIKNVITVIAKTCHYWLQHTSPARHQAIADLLRTMELESPLLQPELVDHEILAGGLPMIAGRIAESIQQATGLRASQHRYRGWLGLDCRDLRAALWMMRVLVVKNVLARREGTVVFVPFNSASDPKGERVVRIFVEAHGLVVARDIL